MSLKLAVENVFGEKKLARNKEISSGKKEKKVSKGEKG